MIFQILDKVQDFSYFVKCSQQEMDINGIKGSNRFDVSVYSYAGYSQVLGQKVITLDEFLEKASIITFQSREYKLNQCDDLLEWCGKASVWQFTYYYNKLVFKTPDGVIAAYADNLNNYWSI